MERCATDVYETLLLVESKSAGIAFPDAEPGVQPAQFPRHLLGSGHECLGNPIRRGKVRLQIFGPVACAKGICKCSCGELSQCRRVRSYATADEN